MGTDYVCAYLPCISLLPVPARYRRLVLPNYCTYRDADQDPFGLGRIHSLTARGGENGPETVKSPLSEPVPRELIHEPETMLHSDIQSASPLPYYIK